MYRRGHVFSSSPPNHHGHSTLPRKPVAIEVGVPSFLAECVVQLDFHQIHGKTGLTSNTGVRMGKDQESGSSAAAVPHPNAYCNRPRHFTRRR